MKEELIQIGFTEVKTPLGYETDFLELQKSGFYIEFCAGNGGYFFIFSDKLGDREATPYPYKGIEKLKALIQAHEEYFK